MKTSRQSIILGACLAASAITVPMLVSAGVTIGIDVAPPPIRIETVPAARPGYVWAPGYWDWRENQHVWVEGRWMAERHGYRWEPDRWEQRGPHWYHQPGHWVR